MDYCQGRKQANIRYSVGSGKQLFIASKAQLPISIESVDVSRQSLVQEFYKGFPGQELTTYPFTIKAPQEVGRNISVLPEIYLLSGTWDDHGSIGSYNTGYGLVTSYRGAPLKIGNGYFINGTVTNEIRGGYFVDLTLEWRWDACRINILNRNREKIFSFTGACPIKFSVSCDDECPAGYLRCETSQYPGYSCIPCSEIQSQIAAIRNNIRRLK